jgi:hypothetical protein
MNNESIIQALSSWGNIAYESESFKKLFCPHAWIITQVTWDSDNMRLVYILDNGQHVADSFKMEEWLKFLETKIQ